MITSEVAVPEIPGISIERAIGRGTASVVYRASRGMKTVAVKVSNRPTEELDQSAIQRFLREGSLLGSLDHPALPSIYEVSQTAETLPISSTNTSRGGRWQRPSTAINSTNHSLSASVIISPTS